ncbi:MAG TPA: hypothetical protein VMT85_00705, partial [Thermoanaerobaculia bacterium]|nr:hypothetical protein [Thermoanaerobaculia bacterium]
MVSIVLFGIVACDGDEKAQDPGGERSRPPGERDAARSDAAVGEIPFEDVTDELGVDFVHSSGSEGSYPMPAIMGGGLAVFDYDGDDDLDLYFVQGGNAFTPGGGRSRIGNELFRQEQDGSFVEVAVAAGADDRGYGMGAAVGD